MVYQIKNKPNTVKVDETPNPVYGPMDRKVTPTGPDSWELQHRQAMIPYRTINVENDLTKYSHQKPIESVPVDLTPIRKMDDLR